MIQGSCASATRFWRGNDLGDCCWCGLWSYPYRLYPARLGFMAHSRGEMTRDKIETEVRKNFILPENYRAALIDFALAMCARQAEEDAQIAYKVGCVAYCGTDIRDDIRANAPKVEK